MVGAFSTECGIILGQDKTNVKSDEITTISGLFNLSEINIL